MATATIPTPRITNVAAITAEHEERVWKLREDEQSYRQISVATGLTPRQVAWIILKDPDRKQAIMDVHREDRARLYAQLEVQGLRRALEFIDAGRELFLDSSGKLRKAMREKFAALGAQWAGMLRQAAEGATKQQELLSGGATERVEGAAATVEVNLTVQALIDEARELDMMDHLPPAIRAKAVENEAREEERSAKTGRQQRKADVAAAATEKARVRALPPPPPPPKRKRPFYTSMRPGGGRAEGQGSRA